MKNCRRFLASLALAVICLSSVQTASAVVVGPITVTNLNDSGTGSLRQAIADAVNGQTIDFDASLSGTINLASGLTVNKSITIAGPGANVISLNGNGACRGIYSSDGGFTINISGLTFENFITDATSGSGAAIHNLGSTVSVSYCAFKNNSQAAYGGAIFVWSNNNAARAGLNIRSCTFSGNSAAFGGAVATLAFNDGSVQLNVFNSTFSGNSANSFDYGGGAIANLGNSSATIKNCTFSGNSSGNGRGGAIYGDDDNTGGSVVSVDDTVLQAGDGGTLYKASGAMMSLGYNISSDDGGGFLTATDDQPNTDPLLGPLQDNGGPTPTHALLTGSPALDAGNPYFDGSAFTPPLDTDQRGPGFPRVMNGRIDIGAFEAQFLYVTNTNDSGDGSLRQALDNNPSDNATVIFDPAVTGTITLTSGQIAISHGVRIPGPGARVLSLTTNGNSRIFEIGAGVSFTAEGLTFRGGGGEDTAGAIYVDHASVALVACAFDGNTALWGGAVAVSGADSGSAGLVVRDCTFSNNAGGVGGTGGVGGALYLEAGNSGKTDVAIVNSTFSSNSVSGGVGGAIYNTGSNGGSANLAVSHSTFSGNSASAGGAIMDEASSGAAAVTLSHDIFNAGASGGTLANSGDSATTTSQGYNLASDNGGGFLTATGDQVNKDPKLTPLAYHHGPTRTHALQSGSPAIDAGDPAFDPNSFAPPLDHDQRGAGYPRVIGSAIDLGSFEDERAVVEFAASSYDVNENAGYVTFTLKRTGALYRDVTVHIGTADGSATAGSDYVARSFDKVIPAGVTSITGRIAIINDHLAEGTEIFYIGVDPTSSADIGVTTFITVNIHDYDGGPPMVQFESATYQFKENTGFAVLKVNRVGNQGTAVTVSYNTVDGSAKAGVDYTATSGTVTFDPGVTETKTITVPLTNDRRREPNKKFEVRLDSSPSAGLTDPATATVTILDYD